MTDLVNLRGWPGLDNYKPPRQLPRARPRIAGRASLVLFAAGDTVAAGISGSGVTPDLDAIENAHAWEAAVLAEVARRRAAASTVTDDHLGLGAYLVIDGPRVLDAGIIVPDDLAHAGVEPLHAWAEANPVSTVAGRRPWAVVAVSEFCDPFVGVSKQPPRGVGVFTQRAYVDAGFVVGADLGRTLGLLAEHVVQRREPRAHDFEVWLPGWGQTSPKGVKRVSPHRPQLRLASRRVGWSVEFAPCKGQDGKHVDGHRWRGAFVDLPALAYALDASRSASFSEHRQAFGLEAFDLPICVDVDASGAAAVAAAVSALHETALVLDDHAARWFTTGEERILGRTQIDVARTTSPGALAAQLLARSGAEAPLEKFRLDATEHLRWAESFHGGWCSWEDRLLGVPFPSLEADISSAYPLVAHHLGWWQLLTAGRLDREDVTGELRDACQRAAADPASCLDPILWRRLGFTLAEVVPAGEPWPVEVDDGARADGRFEVVPVESPERPMYFAWPDVVAAAARSGRVPDIISATRLLPVGRQVGLRGSLQVLPDLELNLHPAEADPADDSLISMLDACDREADPAVALVRHRRRLNGTGIPADRVLAAELRVIVNALVFGNGARFDPGRRKIGRKWTTTEHPGPWMFMPLASAVAAGARLLLGVLDRLVVDAGGIVAYRDTDSSFIPSSPDDGEMVPPDDHLPDGSSGSINLLTYSQVDSMLERFDALRVSDDWPVWTTKRGSAASPLRSLVIGPKRHVSFRGEGSDIDIVGRTDANLGGSYVDPPALRGRAPDRLRAWTLHVVERAVLTTLAGPRGSYAPQMPWTLAAEDPDFPALRRRSVSTPAVLRSLPRAVGARLGSRFVEASEHCLGGTPDGRSFVALDPGGDLADWRSLAWFDRTSGRPVWPETRWDAPVKFTALVDIAANWRRPLHIRPVMSVHIESLLIRHVGRVSGIIDAASAGLPGNVTEERPEYDPGEVWDRRREVVAKYAVTLGPRRFARQADVPLKTAERAALGRRIAKPTVMRALRNLRVADLETRRCGLEGCDHPLFRSNARYCCEAHGTKAYRRRKAAASEVTP